MFALQCDFYLAENKHEADTYCFEGFSRSSEVKSVTIASYAHSGEFSFSLKSANGIEAQNKLQNRVRALLSLEGFTDIKIKDYGTDEFSVTVPLEATWQVSRIARALSTNSEQGHGVTLHKVLSEEDVLALHRSHFTAQAHLLQQKAEEEKSISLDTKIKSISLDEIYKHNPRGKAEESPRYYDADLGSSMTGMILFMEEHGSRFVPETETLIRFIDAPSAKAAAQLMGVADQKNTHQGTLIRLPGRLSDALEVLGSAGILPQVVIDHLKQQQAAVAAQFVTPSASSSKPQTGVAQGL